MNTYGATISKGVRIVDDDVAKGVLRQGVAPRLARRLPVAGTNARRVVRGQPVGKGLNLRLIPKARKAPEAVAEAIKKPALPSGRPLAATQPKDAKVTLKPQRLYGDVQGVGKADVSKAGLGLLNNAMHAIKAPKALLGGVKSGFSAGRVGSATPSLRGPLSAKGFGEGLGGMAGRNPVKTGMAAGALGTAGVLGTRRRDQMYAPSYATGGFGKRSYDPEGERRWRQGAAASATAIGGAELTRRGAMGIRRDTKELRKIPQAKARVVPPPLNEQRPDGRPRDPKVVQARLREIENAKGHNKTVAEHASRLKGVQVRGRNAGKVGAGVALLGVAGTLNRNRHEERWD